MTQHLKVGDVVEAMIINVDRKTVVINLSIKAKDQAEQSSAIRELRRQRVQVMLARRVWALCLKPSSSSNNSLPS